MKITKNGKSLKENIELNSLMKKMNESQEITRRIIRRDIRNLCLILVPTIVLCIIGMVTNNNLIIFSSAGYAGGIGLIKITKDFIKDEILHQRMTKDLDDTVDKIISENEKKIAKEKDYYNDKFKEEIEEEIKENIIKPEEIEVELKDDDDKSIVTKVEVMEKIVAEIQRYYEIYDLPPFTIDNKEMGIIMNTFYEKYKEINIEDYYKDLSNYFNFLFAKTLVEKYVEININIFIVNLEFYSTYSLNIDEIKEIQKNIIKEIKKSTKNNLIKQKCV